MMLMLMVERPSKGLTSCRSATTFLHWSYCTRCFGVRKGSFFEGRYKLRMNSSVLPSSTRRVTTILVDELHAIVSALVGGARYGFKIRTPHALVMTLVFRNDLTSREKLKTIFQLAVEHAGNLAAFATIYKSVLTVLKWSSTHLRNNNPNYYEDNHRQSSSTRSVSSYYHMYKALGRAVLSLLIDGPIHDPPPNSPMAPPGHAEHSYHSFVAGAIGGYYIWGRYSSVNYQIVLYLTSRVLVGLWKRIASSKQGETSSDNNAYYPWAAAIIWGLTMALFEESPHVLHPSLKSSMDEIYRSPLRTLLLLPRRQQRTMEPEVTLV